MKRFIGALALALVIGIMFILSQRQAGGEAPATTSVAGSVPYTPVLTPNGSTLPWTVDQDGAKVFRLTVELCRHELAPGMVINAWCYNGQTPGPTIEAVEGDSVRIYVTNKLPEPTAVHWHGVILPSGMDGVQGLTQRGIPPGDTFLYEFPLKQHGTQMYHSHGDEMTQIGLGTMGFFVIHPKRPTRKIDRDYALFLNEWFVEPGSATPNPQIMTDFNLFTFNSRAYPGTAPLLAKPGERVRIRFGNVAQDCHPIHLHGHSFKIVATDGGDIPDSAQWPETTVTVCPGQTRDVEFVANPGDWAMHCHKRHHPMNAMSHDVPLMLGVNQDGVEGAVRQLVPGYMAMGEKGMHEMTEMGHMAGPPNTLPMMAANDGPFGSTGMGGMFTIVKVHPDLPAFRSAQGYATSVQLPGDLGWYKNPLGTVSESVQPAARQPEGPLTYVCPMHPEVRQQAAGSCPKCGMTLKPQQPGSIEEGGGDHQSEAGESMGSQEPHEGMQRH